MSTIDIRDDKMAPIDKIVFMKGDAWSACAIKKDRGVPEFISDDDVSTNLALEDLSKSDVENLLKAFLKGLN